MVQTWKDDLKGIEFKLLKYSNPDFWNIHTVMNDISIRVKLKVKRFKAYSLLKLRIL